MKRTLSALAIAAFAAVIPAQATVFSANFTGTVYQTQGATGEAVGSTVTGHFDLNQATGDFLDFTIGGHSVASGFASSVTIGPALTDAIYEAQVSPVSTGMSSNSTFSLDLSSLTNWPSNDPYSLLTNTGQLTSNLDTVNNPLSAFPSTFGYYTANANGTNVLSVEADLTSFTAAAPEPASLALMGCALVGLGVLVRRRR